MYQTLQPGESFWSKFYRYLYPIISISLLNFTMSNTYSLMTNDNQSTGFISIIVSSLICFVFSQSHLTIYGVSVLSIVYINMLKPTYNHSQTCVITFLAGLLGLLSWRFLHGFGDLFHYFPGKIHAGMVLGVGMIVLTKFFPLTIENVRAFYQRDSSILSNPLKTLLLTFSQFSLLTLILTTVSISVMFFARRKLARFPSILLLALIGLLANIKNSFLTYESLCSWSGVDCSFYLVNLKNVVIPRLEEMMYLLPASVVLAAVLMFEQFLYIEEFRRLGRKNREEGDLGDIQREVLVMSCANIVCGIVGGLPVCINLFATYENYSFTKKYHFRGTKVVGLSQIIFNYLLYGPLKSVYDHIPLFVIFCIIGTPLIYFFKTVYKYFSRDLRLVAMLGILNVLTHPVFALVIASFYTIYQMASLLKPAPAEIIVQGGGQGQIQLRQSTTFQKIQNSDNDQYYAKIISIEDDLPKVSDDYLLYRFTGSISYLNFHQHHQQILSVISRKGKKRQSAFDDLFNNLMFSFRYVQNIDGEAMEEFEYLVRQIKESNRKKKVIITGLHSTLLTKFKNCAYFRKMLEEEERCFFRLHGKDLL